MSGIHKDRILESCLEELLSGQRPPDVADRVIRAAAARPAAAATSPGQASVAIPPIAGSGQAVGGAGSSNGHRVIDRPLVSVAADANRLALPSAKKRRLLPWAIIAFVAASVAVAVGIALQVGDDPQPVANQPKPVAPNSVDGPKVVEKSPSEEMAPAPTTHSEEMAPPETVQIGPRVADTDSVEQESSASPASVKTLSTTDDEIVTFINSQIREAWKTAKVGPSPNAEDAEWCRRVYLDLLGRIPSIEELQRYVADRSKDKKEKLVDELLGSDRHAEEYARNWTTIWTNILIGRSGGVGNNATVSRAGMQQYLRRTFQRNKPYDQMVTELLTAEGAGRPGDEGYNGAVNFIADNLQEDATTATAKTARYFLGMQVQCTQCHNHPFNDWKQNQFWELNAFFRQARAIRTGDGDTRGVTLRDADFAGETGRNPNEAEIFYELRNGKSEVAYPAFVDGTALSDRSGKVSQVRRRVELAKFVVASPNFGEAIVNRMWSHFLGYGFTKPIDDIGPHNAFSHDALVKRLGVEFAGGGHDLKRLMRWIVLSEPYALSSVYGNRYKNAEDDPLMGNKPLFSHFYMRQMEAEQLYQSLLVATQADRSQGSFEEQERVKAEWLQQFTIAFGTDEGDEATTFNGTVPQVLMMMNGELVDRAVDIAPGSFLHRVVYENPNRAQSLDQLYMAALGRAPTRQEINAANELLKARNNDAAAAMQDVWWALLNSGEFIFNR